MVTQTRSVQSFHLFPIIQGTLEIDGKDWKQKARNLSNYFHSAARLARSDRGDGRLIKVAEAVHLDQGIAVTSHASQGKTVDQVIVSVPVSAFSQANQAQFYVSMSRARASMHLFTDSKAALKEAVMRPSERLSPYEFISKSGNGRDLVAFVTRSGREAVKQTEREMER